MKASVQMYSIHTAETTSVHRTDAICGIILMFGRSAGVVNWNILYLCRQVIEVLDTTFFYKIRICCTRLFSLYCSTYIFTHSRGQRNNEHTNQQAEVET